jgi:hypothetical protein
MAHKNDSKQSESSFLSNENEGDDIHVSEDHIKPSEQTIAEHNHQEIVLSTEKTKSGNEEIIIPVVKETVREPDVVQVPVQQRARTRTSIPGCGCALNLFACSGCFLLLLSLIIISILIWVNF